MTRPPLWAKVRGPSTTWTRCLTNWRGTRRTWGPRELMTAIRRRAKTAGTQSFDRRACSRHRLLRMQWFLESETGARPLLHCRFRSAALQRTWRKPTLFHLLHRKLMHGRRPVRLPQFEQRAGEFWLVRGVGEVLGFQTEGVVLFEAVAGGGAVEEVAAVELDGGLGGGDFHHSAAGGVFGSSRQGQLALLPAEDVAVVISLGLVRLFL